jgi:glycosyltransferase involved in cell wall biosynthesis
MISKKPSIISSDQHIFSPVSTSRIAFRLFILRLKEWLEFDSSVLKRVLGVSGFVVGFLCYKANRSQWAFGLWSRTHASAWSSWASYVVSQFMRSATAVSSDKKQSHVFNTVFQEYVESLSPTFQTQKFFLDPGKLLGPMAMVLKSRTQSERGVILISYSYAFPLFAKLFDVQRIAEDYFLVLEPSWSGYCNLDILCYSQLDCPVFVEAYEPRDREFIRSLGSNLIPVPICANWWVDHRIFKPVPNVAKDVDLIMVAGWANFKRHHAFFRALKKLRRRGIVLKAILVGYPMGQTKDDVCERAKYYGVFDQLEIHESITSEEVNTHFSRAKVNVLWSRREGWNRAIIEGMFAGVPCVLREGHNYGFRYPYINANTGCYSDDKELPERLLWVSENYKRFYPRNWLVEHMSCEKATQILSESIKGIALKMGQGWTDNIVIKVSGLHGMQYWNIEDREKFNDDYQFLHSCIR